MILQPDQWGDPTPDTVYKAVCEPLVKAGVGDLELYRVMDALRVAYTRAYEIQEAR